MEHKNKIFRTLYQCTIGLIVSVYIAYGVRSISILIDATILDTAKAIGAVITSISLFLAYVQFKKNSTDAMDKHLFEEAREHLKAAKKVCTVQLTTSEEPSFYHLVVYLRRVGDCLYSAKELSADIKNQKLVEALSSRWVSFVYNELSHNITCRDYQFLKKDRDSIDAFNNIIQELHDNNIKNDSYSAFLKALEQDLIINIDDLLDDNKLLLSKIDTYIVYLYCGTFSDSQKPLFDEKELKKQLPLICAIRHTYLK